MQITKVGMQANNVYALTQLCAIDVTHLLHANGTKYMSDPAWMGHSRFAEFLSGF